MWKILGSVLNRVPSFQHYRLEGLLADFSRTASETDSPDKIYDAINSLIRRVVTFDRIAIHFIDMDSEMLTETFVTGHSVRGWGLQPTRPFARTVTEAVVKSRESFVIADCNDAETQERFPILKMSAALLPSLLCVPMMSSSRPVGAVSLRSKKTGAYSERDVQLLNKVMAHVVPILVNSRDWASSQRQVRERTLLAEIGRLASSTIDFSVVWDQLVNTVRELISCDRMVLALVEEDGETITDRFVFGVQLEHWDENPRRKKIKVPADGIIRSKSAVIVEKAENDAEHLELLGYKISERVGLKTSMYAALMAGDRAIGTLSVRSLKEHAYSEDDRELFGRIATQIGGPVAAAELYSRSQRLATEIESRIRLELDNKKLEAMNQSKARFISMVSHELRTPLTSMIAFADIISRNRDNTIGERDLAHLEVVKRNGSRLRLLIEDLLAMSEIDTGDISIVRSEFSVQESVSQLGEAIEPLLNAKNQKLKTEFSESNIKLYSDRIRLEQILSNLVSNASKYSGNESEIKIDVFLESDRVKIAVIDSGEGIAEEEIPTLFEEFSRLDNEVTRANQGSGLGLAISRRLAAALGGTVEVASKKGEGSIFTLILPVDLPKAA